MNMTAHKEVLSQDLLPLLSSLTDHEVLSVLPMGCAVFDRNGCCIYLNPAGQLLIGHPLICPKQTPFYQFKGKTAESYPHEQLPFVKLPFVRALKEGVTVTTRNVMFFRQGTRIILEMQAIPLSSRQLRQPIAIVLLKEITDDEQDIQTLADITEQKKAETLQKSGERQLKYLSKIMLGVSFRYALDDDGNYGFCDLDEQIQDIYGIDRQVVINNPEALESIAHPEDRDAVQEAITKTLTSPQSFNLEYRIVTPQGQIKWTKVIAQHERQIDGKHVWYGMILDITERKQVETILADYNQSLEEEVYERTLELELEVQERKRAEEKARGAELALREANTKLELLATSDGLTQIANRRRFDTFLSQTWRTMMREGQKMSVIMCDVDYFKRYNDTYGHQAGDVCLQRIAEVLQKTANRGGDLVARYGGEEFGIILGNTDELGAGSLCHNIRWAMAELNMLHSASDVSSHVTLSIGICTMVPSLKVLPESLVMMADKALYKAKHQGRNRVVHSSDYIVS